MSKRRKSGLLMVACMVGFALLAAPAVAADDIEEMEELGKALEDFGKSVTPTLGHYNAIGLQWSDAYIGQLLRVPPNVGLGITAGAATLPFPEAVQDEIGEEIPFADTVGVPIPAYTVDARVGGLILPFDVGVKVGLLQEGDLMDEGLKIDYLLAGADVRFSVIDEGVVLPGVSAGVGLNYSQMVLGVTEDDQELDPITVNDEEYQLTFKEPGFRMGWENSRSIDFKAQASKRLLIFQPFLGAAATYTTANVGGQFSTELLVDGDPYDPDDVADDVAAEIEDTLETEDPTDLTFGRFQEHSAWSGRLFGGLGLRLLVLRLDVGASIDSTGSVGGQVNARIQL